MTGTPTSDWNGRLRLTRRLLDIADNNAPAIHNQIWSVIAQLLNEKNKDPSPDRNQKFMIPCEVRY